MSNGTIRAYMFPSTETYAPCANAYMPVTWTNYAPKGQPAASYWEATWPVAPDGNKIPFGLYYQAGGDRAYLLPYSRRDCLEATPAGTLWTGGLVVSTQGVHVTGGGNLRDFVEVPLGSGNFQIKPPGNKQAGHK
jgi:hypothetical protein